MPATYLAKFGSDAYEVTRYEIEIEYLLSANRINGSTVIGVVPTVTAPRLSLDLSPALSVAKVYVDGKAVRFAHRDSKLVVTAGFTAGTPARISVRYGGKPRPIRGPWGTVGWEELTDGVLVASQPNGASSWFPCNDRPSSKAPYTISVTTDNHYFVIANGELQRKRVRATQTTWVYEQFEPMAPYLATVSIGRYRHHQIAENPVPVFTVTPETSAPLPGPSFVRQAEMVSTFSDLFGPYPFPQYTAVIADDDLEIPIEAQSLSTFGRNHCTDPERNERLVAHELAHQWFGNSLTAAHWSDIWLHEGFACYSEWLWSERSGGPNAASFAHKYYQRLAHSPHTIVVGDPGARDMFDDRVYKRGAMALHAARVALGDAAFFATLRSWAQSRAHSVVTATEFFDHVHRETGRDLSALWHEWLYQRALPPFPELAADAR